MKQSGRASILLVDDEQDILDILARTLVMAGYDVDMANNGRVALDRLALADYDLIISNIRMPVMGGEEFYGQLSLLHPRLAKKIIFCTGDIANPTTQRFLTGTGAPVIFKPFQLTTVLEVVSWKLAKERATALVPAFAGAQPAKTAASHLL